MRILITGHKGLLGSACVRYFTAQGHEILTMPRAQYNLRLLTPTLRFFMQEKPDWVIHCAAKVGGVKSNRDNPIEFLLENLQIQNSVIEAAAETGVEKLVFIGTSCMFPKDTALPVHEESLLTGSLEDSVEAYAVAKIAGWRLCKAYWEQRNKQFYTVCPSNIYGPNDNYGTDAHVIPSLIRKYAQSSSTGEPFTVWGTGAAIREFIYSDDVASAIDIVMQKWNSPEVINVGTGISTSISELVGYIKATAPTIDKLPTVWNARMPEGIPRKTYDISRLTSLGWFPKISLAEGLHETWKDFLENKNLRK